MWWFRACLFFCLGVLPFLNCLVVLCLLLIEEKMEKGLLNFLGKGMTLPLLTFHCLKLVTWCHLNARGSEKWCFWPNCYFLGTTLYHRKKYMNFCRKLAIFATKESYSVIIFDWGSTYALQVEVGEEGGGGVFDWYSFSILRSSVSLCF